MSRLGFFQQPALLDVYLGMDAPCSLVKANDTYISCISYRNTFGESFNASVFVHGKGLAYRAPQVTFTYDFYVSSMSVRTGSIEGPSRANPRPALCGAHS